MAGRAAARRYAKALYQLARGEGQVPQVSGELTALQSSLAESAELQSVLLQPLHPASQRRAVLAAVADGMNASPLLRSFYSFLIDQRRLVDLDAIIEEYERLAAEEAGVTQAEIVSARPLSDAQRERLTRALSNRTGQQLELEVRVDPELLGGVVAKVGDLVFDGSLRTQLQQLKSGLASS